MLNSAAIVEARKQLADRSATTAVPPDLEEQVAVEQEEDSVAMRESSETNTNTPPATMRIQSEQRRNPFMFQVNVTKMPESVDDSDEELPELVDVPNLRKFSLSKRTPVVSSQAVEASTSGLKTPLWPPTSVTWMQSANKEEHEQVEEERSKSAQPWLGPTLRDDRAASVKYSPQLQAESLNPKDILSRSIDKALNEPLESPQGKSKFSFFGREKEPNGDSSEPSMFAIDKKDYTGYLDPKRPSFFKSKGGIASLTIISLLVGACVAMGILCFFFWRGTESTVSSYLEKAGNDERARILAKFGNFTNLPEDFSPLVAAMNVFTGPKGSDLRQQNTFDGLNREFQDDILIRELMTNPELHNTFYGVTYAPKGSLEPMCGANLHDITLDMALLSTVTTRVRLYGMQCKQADYVLEAIDNLGLNMTVALGVWIGKESKLNEAQLKSMEGVLRKYPRHMFESIFVGNEVLYRDDQNSSSLANAIKSAKKIAVSVGYLDLPVGTAEIGSKVDETLLKAGDFLGANIHPFFSGEPVQLSTKWATDFFNEQVGRLKSELNLGTELVISETGWPYNGGKFLNSVAGPKHMQYFLDQWVCDAYKQNTGWYYFEAFDEPWKSVWHTGSHKWETEWGIFTSDRRLKDGISLPDCLPLGEYIANSTKV